MMRGMDASPLTRITLRTGTVPPKRERPAIAASPRSGNRGTHLRARLRALGAVLVLLWPAAALAGDFTPQQRTEIVAIVRQALRDDPSILRDALGSLKQDEDRQQASAAHDAITAHARQLRAESADPVAGNPHGDLTIVEFYDPRCPFCRSMRPVVASLLASDPGIRLVYKDIPILGPASVLDATALLAAQRQGGYLTLQAAEMGATATPTAHGLQQEATRLGLDPARLQHDMADAAIRERLAANVALARALGVDGTPSFVIGDQIVAGAVPISELREAVASARQH
jgi:protein-disulfide isomerase